MSIATDLVPAEGAFVLRLGPLGERATEDDFFDFCQANPGWRIERTSAGEVILMPPVGGEGGRRESRVLAALYVWAEHDGRGEVFSPSTAFRLPNGAVRSPDAAWMVRSRWETLTREQQERFPPVCPDFVAEIRSRTDRLAALQEKMAEYIASGEELGWLIDPVERRVHVYRRDKGPEVLDDPETISGEPVLAGFTLELRRIWGP